MAILYSLIITFLGIIFHKQSKKERNSLKRDKYIIKSDKIENDYKIVFLSDIHEKEFGKNNIRLIRMIDKISPDIVIIGGDSICSYKKRKYIIKKDEVLNTVKLIKNLSLKYKVFYGVGNHEARLFQKASGDMQKISPNERKDAEKAANTLEEALKKIDYLDDKTIQFKELLITGINPPLEIYKSLFLKKKKNLDISYIPKADKKYFNIYLFHNPMYLKELSKRSPDLVLSGHFHGGTIWLPFVGGLMTPQKQFLKKECAGCFKEKNTKMIVNRGLGTHSVNVRINNLPEISYIKIVSTKGKKNGKYKI